MSQLFSKLDLGPFEIKNRIMVSPMCQYTAIDGVPYDWHLQHLSYLSYSGAAVLMVEMTDVEAIGRITTGCLGLWNDLQEVHLKKIIDFAKKISPTVKFGIQIAHAGRKGSCKKPWDGGTPLTKEEGSWETCAASPLPFETGWPTPKELDEQGIQRIIRGFQNTAERAVRIGFDIIELHSAHGYLLHQFLSPISNQRKDCYGGSLENRMRFPLEVIDAVNKIIPENVALGIRISATDWVEGGLTIDETVEYAKHLKAKGLKYVCVSSGGNVAKAKIPVGPGYQVALASRIKRDSGMITRAVGLITEPIQAEKIIAEGSADCIAIARGFLDDPRWGWHAADLLGAQIEVPPQYQRARPPWRSYITHDR